MKRILLGLLFVTLINVLQGQTNVYHKFLGENLEWTGGFGGYQSPFCYKYKYSISQFDSSTIGPYLYYFIMKEQANYAAYFSGSFAGMCNFSTGYSPNYLFPGSLREDTVLKKVYFLDIDSIHEKLLYDFTLNVGDTVKGQLSFYCSTIVVTQIDSILVGNDYRKRWIVNGGGCLWNGEIIEGIGSNMGLLEPMINFEWGGYLNCYSKNSITLYSTSPDCPILTTDTKITTKISSSSVSPNPAKNSITISQTEPSFNKYEIYDLNGKLITENKIGSIEQKVDLIGYAEGMYIIKLIGTQKVEFKKVMVVE